jgi:hypothetical protein
MRIGGTGRRVCSMAAVFKYLATVAVIVSAIIVGAIFMGFAAVVVVPTTTMPAWKIDRLKAEPEAPYLAAGSLSPIYPATPGKELLGKPVQTFVRAAKHHQVASAKPVVRSANMKHLDVSQLRADKLPRQIYAMVEHDRNYLQQSHGYAEESQAHTRTSNFQAHGLY